MKIRWFANARGRELPIWQNRGKERIKETRKGQEKKNKVTNVI
jgi:hypothetical protein